MKKKAVIVTFRQFSKEPRVLRTISALKNEYDITVYSVGGNPFDYIRYKDIQESLSDFLPPAFHLKWPAPLRKIASLFLSLFVEKKFNDLSYYKKKFWTPARKALVKDISNEKAEVVVAHGIMALPVVASVDGAPKKVFNAHEFYTREFEESPNWMRYTKPYYEYILKNYLSKTNLVVNVGEEIRKEYKKEFGVDSFVINNARDFVELEPKLLNGQDKIKLVHHGGAIRGRKLELIFDMMAELSENYELHMILMRTDPQYYAELVNSYGKNKSIFFHDAVAMEDIPGFINRFDIGVYILPPTNFNNYVALPNKFFDFVQARLCVATSPNIEMKSLIDKYKLGITSQDYTVASMCAAIKTLSVADINQYKQNVHACARLLSGESNEEIFLKAVA